MFNNVKELNYTIQYDSNYTFNPIKISRSDNNIEINLEWLGRKLTKYNDVNFKYNCHGVRIEKDSPDNKTMYFVEGDRIKGMRIHDKVNGGYIGYNFTYNSNNEVETICVNNEYYYYERDITKNINKILDSNGNVVVSYRYDAWGNVLEEVVTNSNLRFNPFLYKGYVYDRETKLYWVTTRYYSPELCRWLSPDSIEYLDPENVDGLNLYCYCFNDPINNYDPTGHFVITLSALLWGIAIGSAIGAGIGLAATVVKDLENGDLFDGDVSFLSYLGNFVGGGIAGTGIGLCSVLGAGLGVAISTKTSLIVGAKMVGGVAVGGIKISGLAALGIGAGGAFATGGLGYAARTGISNQEKFELSDMFIEAGINMLSGMTTFAGSIFGGLIGIHVPGKFSVQNFALNQMYMGLSGFYGLKYALSHLRKNYRRFIND